MSVRPLNKRFALIVALYNCRKREYNPKHSIVKHHPLLTFVVSQNLEYCYNAELVKESEYGQ